MLGNQVSSVSQRLRNNVQVISLSDIFDFDTDPFSNAIVTDRYSISHPNTDIIVPMSDCICYLESGNRPKGGISETNDGIGSLGGEHVDENLGELTTDKMKYVSQEYYHSMKKGHVQSGDILICKDGAKTGKCAYYEGQENYCVNEHVFIVRSNPQCDQKYLFYFMMSTYFRKQVERLAYNKKGQPGLNKAHIRKILVPRLAPTEQEEVVSEIEKEWNSLVGRGERREFVDCTFRDIGLYSIG